MASIAGAIKARPMRALPLLMLFLPACASADGKWPSLARRPGELAAAPVVSAPAADPAAPPVTSGPATVAAARLTQVERDVVEAETRWKRQNATAQAAAAAARGAAASSEPWAKAQLELSRLEKAGAALADLRARLDSITGELAVASSGGATVAAPLGAAGRLIERVEALRADHARSFAAAQAQLQR